MPTGNFLHTSHFLFELYIRNIIIPITIKVRKSKYIMAFKLPTTNIPNRRKIKNFGIASSQSMGFMKNLIGGF
jgi:hypothetical protein